MNASIKSYYSCKTNRPKINLNKYLNGIFNTVNEINHQNYKCRNNEKNRENIHMEEKDTKVDSSSGDESGFSSKELVSILPNNSVPFN